METTMLKTVGTSGQITLGKKFAGQCFEVRIWPKITSFLLVPKLTLGNGVFEAPASRRTAKQELAR